MPISKLDHVNIRTANLDAMIAWYEDVLGLDNGKRPDFGFPGAWLYSGADALVHLVAIDETDAVGTEASLKLEHFAFQAEDLAAFTALLDAREAAYETSTVPGYGITQVNVWDPDGNHIHVDFRE